MEFNCVFTFSSNLFTILSASGFIVHIVGIVMLVISLIRMKCATLSLMIDLISVVWINLETFIPFRGSSLMMFYYLESPLESVVMFPCSCLIMLIFITSFFLLVNWTKSLLISFIFSKNLLLYSVIVYKDRASSRLIWIKLYVEKSVIKSFHRILYSLSLNMFNQTTQY